MAGLRSSTDGSLIRGWGTFDQFLAALLAVESGIDPNLFDWYVNYYSTPVIEYPMTSAPGRVVRELDSGEPCFEKLTVKQYFQSLDVDRLFDPSLPDCLTEMQYRSMNALGFVGYQIGESVLMRTGYYQPARASLTVDGASNSYAKYYVGASVPIATWRHGRNCARVQVPGSDEEVIATDVNTWTGQFTGKNQVTCLDDLRSAHRQEIVMRDLLEYSYRTIARKLKESGADFDSGTRSHPSMPGNRQANLPNRKLSVSASLAAAHLCGADAVFDFLLRGTLAQDEFGTSIVRYFQEFEGYDTPFGLCY